MSTRRTMALRGVRDLIAATWGPTAEGGDGTLRAVYRRPWTPADKLVQAATVMDDGQRRVVDEGDDESDNLLLAIKIVFDLAGEWRRQNKVEDMSDFVQLVIKRLSCYLPPNCGAIAMRYIDDDPVDALLGNGQTRQLWVVSFELTYFDFVTDGAGARPEDT
jgi:hypothetical protein